MSTSEIAVNPIKIYLPKKLIELKKLKDPKKDFINIYSLFGTKTSAAESAADELKIESFKYSSSIDNDNADFHDIIDDIQKENFVGYLILSNGSEQFSRFIEKHLFEELSKLGKTHASNDQMIHFIIYDLMSKRIEPRFYQNGKQVKKNQPIELINQREEEVSISSKPSYNNKAVMSKIGGCISNFKGLVNNLACK